MYQSIDHLSSVSDNEMPVSLRPIASKNIPAQRLQHHTPQEEEQESSIHTKKKFERSSSLNSIENQLKTDPQPVNSHQELSNSLHELHFPSEPVIKLTKIDSNPTIENAIHHDFSGLHRNESSHLQQPEVSREFKRMRSLPSYLVRPGEEAKKDLSMDSLGHGSEAKEPGSAEAKPILKEEKNSSFLSDIVISKKRGADEQKKSTLKRALSAKPVTISLTFDAFVDQVKGKQAATLASNYPDYKIDKRLIFLGKEVDFPWHIISYNSTFRKAWNLFILAVIIYQIFWYPLAVTFIFGESWPLGIIIFEIISIFIFLLDIIINIRTTYSNENNEEIIDSKMIRKNYISKKLFIVDVITTLPIPEILLLILMNNSSIQWAVYPLVNLIRLLRVFKISTYLENRTLGTVTKLLRIFIAFFIVVHWVSCVWYIIILAEYNDETPIGEVWFPNNLRMVATGHDDLIEYYNGMHITKVYGYTLLSVFMLAVGSDMAPATDIQIWMSVFVGLFGAVSVAYIFGLVTLIITKANEETSLYQQQLEELKSKLRINKIPHNLRIKVMEYFYYSWRKNSVLKKMDDFSELSLPLQRDIALYQHQEMIMKVPLFKELDPVEILSIIQKLKTSIYMPGDKIIREGERGTEMFFIQEGSVEKLIKKPTTSNRRQSTRGMKYERVVLERGSYFGEVALMSNSKRTFDANAFEFCILYTLSRPDYENLKSEFKDIGPRLRSGLKHYKNTHMSLLIQILQNLDIFKGFTPKELQRVGDEYLEEVFVDPDRVILDPKERINAIYVMLNGTVSCYEDNEETRNYLNNLKRSNDNNWTIVDAEEEEEIECLDDDILSLEKDKHSIDDQKNKLDLIKLYSYGDYFGTLDFDINEIKCDKYYVSDTGCQIGAITQALKSQMANEDPELYEKLKNNIIRCSPKRVMVPIEEESDSSFTTKNNTFLKARINRRTSNYSDIGKKPILIKANKKDDILTAKEELQQLEEEMNTFRNLISETNNKLFRIISNAYNTNKSEESTPEKPRRPVEKFVPKKNASSAALIQVDEVNIEESRL